MFGGGGAGFGGIGGYSGGGATGGATDNDPDRAGGGMEAGGFNTGPSGGFGGGNFDGGPMATQSGGSGLGGFPQNGESPERKQPGQGQQQQSMMPLTLRMLLDAHERRRESGVQQGLDTPLVVNGRELHMFTLVACIETISMDQIYKSLQVNDGTGRMTVKQYHDATQAGNQELQLGEYVRIFGSLRYWNGEFHISAHHIEKVVDPNEVSFHYIEVAHVHLSLAGKMPSKAAPSPAAAAQGGGIGAMGGGNNTRPGDWMCPSCNVNNFASRTSCFRCGAPKPMDGGGQQPGATPGGPGTVTSGFGGGGQPGQAYGGAPANNAYSGAPGGLGFGGAGGVWGQPSGGGFAPQQQAQFGTGPAGGQSYGGQSAAMGQRSFGGVQHPF